MADKQPRIWVVEVIHHGKWRLFIQQAYRKKSDAEEAIEGCDNGDYRVRPYVPQWNMRS
jgi:hypothetical protein